MKELELKVCGMRDVDNIIGLTAIHPDFIGFIFYKKSSRYVDDAQAKKISLKIDNQSFSKKVGVFVNPTEQFILQKNHLLKLDAIQLHGTESSDFCASLQKKGFQVIKAFSVDDHFDFTLLEAYQGHCDYFLFDTKGQLPGGNGLVFNWSILKNYIGQTPFLLSGGISIDHVALIKKMDHPRLQGVDINSGFERQPGLKELSKIKQFKASLQQKSTS